MSDIRFIVEGYQGELNVADFDLQQDATPLAPGDSSGSVGDITVSVRAKTDGKSTTRTPGLVNRKASVSEVGDVEYENPITRGVVSGKISRTQTAGARTTLSIDSILAPLQADREVPPFYGTKRSPTLLESRDNLYANNFNVNITGSVFAPVTGAGATSQVANGGPFNDYGFLRATWTTASTAAGSVLFGPSTAIVAGNTYTLSHHVAYSRATATLGSVNQRLRIGIRWYNSSSAVISSSESADFNTVQGSWVRAFVTAQAPAGAIAMRSYAITAAGTGYINPAVGNTLDLSGNLLEQSSIAGPWFDGSSPNSSWTGAVGLSPSRYRTYTPAPVPNYDATQGNYFRYLCGLVGIAETSVVVDQSFEGVPVSYPHWKGNVWEYMKRFAVAIGADILSDQDLIYLRPKRSYVTHIENSANVNVSVDGQAKAQSVQVYNYNNRWVTNGVAYVDTSVYSLNAGARQYKTVTTDHSFDQVNNPVPVASMPDIASYSGGTGMYVVRDSEGKIVDPVWWTRNGGKITVSFEGAYGAFTMFIIAPGGSAGDYKPPYKIGDTGSEDSPGIYITASGVFTDKQLLELPSGAGPEQTSIEEAATVDNPFLSDASTAYDKGSFAAQDAGGPVVTATTRVGPGLRVSPNGGTGGTVSFGTLPGARFIAQDNIFRITSARSDVSGTDIEAKADMTFADMDELYSITYNEFDITYAGLSFSQFDSLWAPGTTFTQFDAAQPSATFADYDAIFEGMTFDQHSVTPYIGAVTSDDAEALV